MEKIVEVGTIHVNLKDAVLVIELKHFLVEDDGDRIPMPTTNVIVDLESVRKQLTKSEAAASDSFFKKAAEIAQGQLADEKKRKAEKKADKKD